MLDLVPAGPQGQNCANCMFIQRATVGDFLATTPVGGMVTAHGLCRRYPPFTPVRNTDWCGDWAAKSAQAGRAPARADR